MVTFKGDSQTQALTSVGAKDSVYFTQKTYYFYFTLSLLQNTHISLSIIHTFLLKIIFSLNFFYYFPPNTPFSSEYTPFFFTQSLSLSPPLCLLLLLLLLFMFFFENLFPSSSSSTHHNHHHHHNPINEPLKIKPTQDQKPI